MCVEAWPQRFGLICPSAQALGFLFTVSYIVTVVTSAVTSITQRQLSLHCLPQIPRCLPAPFLSSYPVISFPHIIRILSVGFRIIQFSLACCPLHVRSALEHSLFVCDSSVLLSAAILPGTLSRLIILQSGSYLHVEYIQSVRRGRESAAILAEQEMGMRLTGVNISLPYRRVPVGSGPLLV